MDFTVIPIEIPIAILFAILTAVPIAIPIVLPSVIPTASPSRTSGLAPLAHHQVQGLSQPRQDLWQWPVLRDERDPNDFFFF